MVITVEEERAEELHGGYFFFRKLTFYWGGMSEAMVFTSSPCVPPHFPAALDMRLGSLDMRLGSLDWVLLDGNVGRDRPTFKNTLQRTSLVDRGLRFCTSSAGGKNRLHESFREESHLWPGEYTQNMLVSAVPSIFLSL